MLLPVVVLGTLLAAPLPSPLTLELKAQKTDLLVGEPTKVDVTWSSAVAMDVWPDRLEVWLDDGTGAGVWLETRDSREDISVSIDSARALRPGSPLKTSRVVGVTGSRGHGYRFAFPTVGRYALTARYSEDGVAVVSNPVVVWVKPPAHGDAELFETYVKSRPEVVSADWWRALYDGLEPIFARYGNSVYLARARLLFRAMKVEDAIIGAPDADPPNTPLEGDVPRALDQIALEDLGTSVFDEDRLVLLAHLLEKTRRHTQATAARQQLVKKYPDGAAAYETGKRLGRSPVR